MKNLRRFLPEEISDVEIMNHSTTTTLEIFIFRLTLMNAMDTTNINRIMAMPDDVIKRQALENLLVDIQFNAVQIIHNNKFLKTWKILMQTISEIEVQI